METKSKRVATEVPETSLDDPHFLETTVAVKQAHIEVGMEFLFEPGVCIAFINFIKKDSTRDCQTHAGRS
jgi:hypothetical protein